MLDRLVALAGSQKRLTAEQVRREYPDTEDDPGLLARFAAVVGGCSCYARSCPNKTTARLQEEEAPIIIEHVETEAGSDPVRMYLREIGRVPLLNSAEEAHLAETMQVGLRAHEQLEKEQRPMPKRKHRLQNEIAEGESARHKLGRSEFAAGRQCGKTVYWARDVVSRFDSGRQYRAAARG